MRIKIIFFTLINGILGILGFYIIRRNTLNKLKMVISNGKKNHKEQERIMWLLLKLSRLNYKGELRKKVEDFIFSGLVKSQDLQDVKAYVLSNFKTKGYYIEFGADDGIKNSNTFLLNKMFGWSGILVEPNPEAYKYLSDHRKDDICKNDLIFKTTGQEVEFSIAGQLSTITDFVESDYMRLDRLHLISDKRIVKTKTLVDLLVEVDSPKEIDFLSIDTEGSEFEILSVFDFNNYKIQIICVEHNNNILQKEKINNLLKNKGYIEILFEEDSIDSFYILN